MTAQQLTFQFPKGNKPQNSKGNATCLECERHNRFWICEAVGKSMNPYYCAQPCKFFRPKSKVLV